MKLSQNDFGLRPQDPFKVLQAQKLSASQLEVLNRLFTPLIGTTAIGVYHYLSQFAEVKQQKDYTHYVILSELKLNLGQFREEMNRLEAIGLIKTYAKHDENQSQFVYLLVDPPSPKTFFNDPMLSVYLYKEVEGKRFHELRRYFETTQVDLSNYHEVTRNFTDVFKVPNHALDKVDTTHQITESQKYDGMNLDRVHFDFELLYQLLSNHFVSAEIIEEKTKHLITQLAVLYGITPEGMKNLILKSLTSAQKISFEELRKQARAFYAIEHENQLPSLEAQAEPVRPETAEEAQIEINSIPQTDEEFKQWFKLMDNLSPIDMLTGWSGSEPTPQQKYMIEDIIVREQLPFGVINMLLQYAMLNSGMKLTKKYILEIASNWKKLEISSAEEAYHHVMKLKKDEQERQTKSYQQQSGPKRFNNRRNPVSKEITPDWLLNREHEKRRKKGEKRSSASTDQSLAQDSAAFLQHLKETWKEDE
ncbi:replication initiation and membrane attachment family protein [Staphylococcus simulans]|uniref:replication initiation and membrane attachment family protein n=1 Tax=Staphylococcus simulans TaxID=1286 RepID=UPI0021D45668|nr:DnaD domain protein [Staphylococcus simulans]UXR33886.1 DnaD domain protein [Staphylococcus simulans]